MASSNDQWREVKDLVAELADELKEMGYTEGDPVSAEQSAADKAIWIAGKAVALARAETGRITLGVTHPELDVDELKRAGVRNNVAVDIVFEEDSSAVSMAATPGFMNWQESDLQQLLDQDEDDDEGGDE